VAKVFPVMLDMGDVWSLFGVVCCQLWKVVLPKEVIGWQIQVADPGLMEERGEGCHTKSNEKGFRDRVTGLDRCWPISIIVPRGSLLSGQNRLASREREQMRERERERVK